MKFHLTIFFQLLLSLAFAQEKSQKRGIAYGYHSEADFKAITHGISWWYNWHHWPDQQVANIYQDYEFDFAPMAWNGAFNEIQLRSYLNTHPNVKYLLGFNEPNFKSQANMTPKQAAALWPKLEAIAKDYGLKLVGPAVNYCDVCVTEDGITYTNPYEYMDAFFAACVDCQVDYIAVHNYMCYPTALSSYINGFKKYKKPIWLTEFACWDQPNITLDMQKNLMIGALDLLDNDTSIYRYAWFTGDRTGKYPYLDIYKLKSGVLTELGQLYVNFNSVHDTTYYHDISKKIEAERYSKMHGVSLELTKDFDGWVNVSSIDPGDWLEYNINVPESGLYYLYFRLASITNINLEILEDSQKLVETSFLLTGEWQNWRTQNVAVNLSKGKHKIKVHSLSKFNLNWIHFSKKSNSVPTANAGQDLSISLPQNSVVVKGLGVDTDQDELKFFWEKISGPDQYQISDVHNDTITVSGLTTGVYEFKLTVSDGLETAIDHVKVEVQQVTDIQNIKEKNFFLFPNPTTSFINIKSPANLALVRLADQTGRILMEFQFKCQQNEIMQLDLGDLKNGFYLVMLESSEGKFVQHILKN